MKRYKRIRTLLLCISALLMLSLSAFAAETAEQSENNLIIQYKYEDTPIANAEFDAYRVAENEGGQWKLTAAFSGSGAALDCADRKAQNEAALALKAYALQNDIAPDYTGRTDANGNQRFDAMRPGLYLIPGQRCTVKDVAYTPMPFMAAMSEKSGSVVALPKSEKSDVGAEPITIRAVKVWNDAGHESSRPDSITVALLCDGKVYDTQKLTPENDWSYTWEKLDTAREWLVNESVPENYSYQITRTGDSFIITNTAASDTPTPTPTPPPDQPILPQTGQLWWPVPMLFAAGLLCLLIGFVRRRGDENA